MNNSYLIPNKITDIQTLLCSIEIRDIMHLIIMYKRQNNYYGGFTEEFTHRPNPLT